MILLLSLMSNGEAADVFWNGHYRSQGHFYRSLSLSESNNNAIPSLNYANHWLSLRPIWQINSKVSIHSQLDLLYLQQFGSSPVYFSDPALNTDASLPQSVSPDADGDGSLGASNFQATRVWGEVNSDIGIIRFGRMPVHWGTGLVYNSGNAATQYIGDTADRIQYSKHFNPVYLLLAIESRNEGFISVADDTFAGTVGVYYANERLAAGLYNVYERQVYDESAYGQLTVDLYGEAELGKLDVEGEFAFIYGKGDLENGLDEVSRLAFGGAIDTQLDLEKYGVGLNIGYASGDDNLDDKDFKTFAFDSNYDVSLMLFDQILPTLAPAVSNSSNDGLEYGVARTGNFIGNAMYIQPRFSYQVSDTFTPGFSALFARTAKLPEDDVGNENYGVELNLDLNYSPVEKFIIQSKFGAFFPGSHFTNYSDPDFGGGFNQTAYGAELNAVVDF
jgi:hypothetical protein